MKNLTDLGHDVDGTHEELVQVSVHHHVRAVDQRVLEAGPDLPPELRHDVQPGAQVSEADAGEVVHLGGNAAGKRITPTQRKPH